MSEGGRGGAESPVVRPMAPRDLPEILAIEGEAFSLPWSLDTFRSLLEREPWALLVLEAPSGEVAGYAVLGCVVDQGELANIAIRAADRGRGWGAILLDGVLAEAARRGVQQLFLEVRRSNDGAAALYRSRGFQEIGIRRNYYEAPREDARVLVKRIHEIEEESGP
jgi:[ribosomal protein S18]-alanine N-acetyltransferase